MSGMSRFFGSIFGSCAKNDAIRKSGGASARGVEGQRSHLVAESKQPTAPIIAKVGKEDVVEDLDETSPEEEEDYDDDSQVDTMTLPDNYSEDTGTGTKLYTNDEEDDDADDDDRTEILDDDDLDALRAAYAAANGSEHGIGDDHERHEEEATDDNPFSSDRSDNDLNTGTGRFDIDSRVREGSSVSSIQRIDSSRVREGSSVSSIQRIGPFSSDNGIITGSAGLDYPGYTRRVQVGPSTNHHEGPFSFGNPSETTTASTRRNINGLTFSAIGDEAAPSTYYRRDPFSDEGSSEAGTDISVAEGQQEPQVQVVPTSPSYPTTTVSTDVFPDVDDSMSMADLKKIIDDEGLPVKKNTGGSSRRTKADIIADIRAARLETPHAAATAAVSITLPRGGSPSRAAATTATTTRGAPSASPARTKTVRSTTTTATKKAATTATPTARGSSAPRRSSSAAKRSTKTAAPLPPPTFQLSTNDSIDGLLIAGNQRIDRVKLVSASSSSSTSFSTSLSVERGRCFFTQLFGVNRVLDKPISGKKEDSIANAIPSHWRSFVDAAGFRFELVSMSLEDDGRNFCGGLNKKLELTYVITEGPGLATIDVERELGRIANFAKLTPRKCVSRLELLASECTTKYRGTPVQLPASDFEVIDEPMSKVTGTPMGEGCGFIPGHLLEKILGVGQKRSQGVVSIQVRVFIPTLGVFKGVLTRTPDCDCDSSSGDKIQLTPSMRKVLPSASIDKDNEEKTAGDHDWACVVVKQNYPSDTSHYFDVRLNGKILKSFQPTTLSHRSKMIPNLLTSLGVPSETIMSYDKQIKEEKDFIPGHAWVVGVIDATHCLPAGCVFLTGIVGRAEAVPLPDSGKIFVTRSPCVLPSAGRLLPVVTTRPAGMSESHWQWLLSLPFGQIIFSSAGGDTRPSIAEACSAGDLDGDLYAVIWHYGIVRCVVEREADLSASMKSTAVAEGEGGDCKEEEQEDLQVGWLSRAQDLMRDPAFLSEKMQIGPLYKMAESIFIEDGHMDSDDYKSSAKAYLQALDIGKHGGQIDLPQHLRERLGRRPRTKAAAV